MTSTLKDLRDMRSALITIQAGYRSKWDHVLPVGADAARCNLACRVLDEATQVMDETILEATRELDDVKAVADEAMSLLPRIKFRPAGDGAYNLYMGGDSGRAFERQPFATLTATENRGEWQLDINLDNETATVRNYFHADTPADAHFQALQIARAELAGEPGMVYDEDAPSTEAEGLFTSRM